MSLGADLRYFGTSLKPGEAALLVAARARRSLARASLRQRVRSDPGGFFRKALPPALRTDAALREHFRSRTTPILPWEDALGPNAKATLDALAPRAVERIVTRAEAILKREVPIFGTAIRLGDPIDWFDVRMPAEPDVFANDVKIPWELSRHQHLVPLALAWRVTGDEKYAREAAVHMTDWIAKNPFDATIHWASALETGIRILAWTPAITLLRSSATMSEALPTVLRSLHEQAAHLETHLSDERVVRTNHLIGELAGLYTFHTAFPEFGRGGPRAVGARRERVLEALVREFEEQVGNDGASLEQSTSYHRFVTEFAVWTLALLRSTGKPAPAALRERCAGMLHYLLRVRTPDGRVPPIGDSDSGRAFLFEPGDPGDPRRVASLLEAGAALLERDVLIGPGNHPASLESVLLLGKKGLAWLRSHPWKAPPAGLCDFADGGNVVYRSDWSAEAYYFFFRSGRFGKGRPKPSAHSHADLLAPVVYDGGTALLVDPGTFGYNIGPDLRDAFRVAAAHNAVVVPGRPVAIPVGTFRWDGIPTAALLEFATEAGEVHARGSHDAWEGDPKEPPLRYSRSFRYNEMQRRFTIADTFHSTGDPALEWFFHLSPRATVALDSGAARARITIQGHAWILEVEQGPFTQEEGWVSERYGVREKAPVLRVSKRLSSLVEGTLRFDLYPLSS